MERGAMNGEGCDWEEGRATGRREARLGGGTRDWEGMRRAVAARPSKAETDEWGWDGGGGRVGAG